MRHGLGILALVAMLASCKLDREADLRADLSRWLALQETQHFISRGTCTVAIFGLEHSTLHPKNGLRLALSTSSGMRLIDKGEAVLFGLRGMSPSLISEALMSKDLAKGLGLLSSGIGPVLTCAQDDGIRTGIYQILVAPQSRLIYVPQGNAMILIYPPKNLAVFLRGNV